MDQAVRRRRQALVLLFLLAGIAMSSWVTRTPAIRDALDVSTAQMGLVLFGLSLGSMLGILASGRLVSQSGTRPVILWATALLILGMAAICAGSLMVSVPMVTAGLCAFGAGMGASDVAANIDATDVERISGVTTMPALHGCFSLGTVLGAGAGMGATAADVPVHWHLAAVTALAVAIFLFAPRAVPAGTGRATVDGSAKTQGPGLRPALWRDGKLVLIGGIVLAMALAEGAANALPRGTPTAAGHADAAAGQSGSTRRLSAVGVDRRETSSALFIGFKVGLLLDIDRKLGWGVGSTGWAAPVAYHRQASPRGRNNDRRNRRFG